MKKITFLFFLFATFSFSQTYKYHRILDLGATLSEANPKFCTTSSSLGSKVNIKIENPLIVGRAYRFSYLSGPRYFKIIEARTTSNQDANENIDGTGIGAPIDIICPTSNSKYHVIKYRGQTQTEANASKCNNDTEASVGININNSNALSVGRIYWIDRGTGIGPRFYEVTSTQNSPNSTAPTTINPDKLGFSFIANCSSTSPSSRPDLSINASNTTISSGCAACANVLSNVGSDRYLANPSRSIMVQLEVRNGGNTTSAQSDIRYFLSSNSTYESSSDIAIGPISTVATITAGSRRLVDVTFFYSDISSALNLTNGNSTILMVVDKAGLNDFNPNESDESNNVTAIPIRFSSSKSSSLKARLNLEAEEIDTYSIEIYNFQGQKVLTEKVTSVEEENAALGGLPKNLYIIKGKNGTRKVFTGQR